MCLCRPGPVFQQGSLVFKYLYTIPRSYYRTHSTNEEETKVDPEKKKERAKRKHPNKYRKKKARDWIETELNWKGEQARIRVSFQRCAKEVPKSNLHTMGQYSILGRMPAYFGWVARCSVLRNWGQVCTVHAVPREAGNQFSAKLKEDSRVESRYDNLHRREQNSHSANN